LNATSSRARRTLDIQLPQGSPRRDSSISFLPRSLLAEAVAKAEAEERARQNAVSFGTVVDAYRAHLRKEGKDWARAESRIANIEAFISRERDSAAVDIVWYRRLLGEVELLKPETPVTTRPL
jgi:hypothetical protein